MRTSFFLFTVMSFFFFSNRNGCIMYSIVDSDATTKVDVFRFFDLTA